MAFKGYTLNNSALTCNLPVLTSAVYNPLMTSIILTYEKSPLIYPSPQFAAFGDIESLSQISPTSIEYSLINEFTMANNEISFPANHISTVYCALPNIITYTVTGDSNILPSIFVSTSKDGM